MYHQIQALPWARDGINETEGDAIKWLSFLARDSEGAAAKIVTMPFMQSLEFDDVLAIHGLSIAARYKGANHLSAIMDHPTVQGGITDELTTLVAAAATSWEPEETRRMLNPSYADIEVQTAGTELSPHLKISVVRYGTPRVTGTIRDLKFAVELLEGLMQTPLPSSHIILVFNDLAVSKGAGAQNQIFALASHVDNEQPVIYASGKGMLHSFGIHEIAHHYFDGNHMEYWLSEAGPTIFEYVYRLGDKERHEAPPRMLQINPRGACEAHDLKRLEEMNVHQQHDPIQFSCNHYLGFEFFRELLETMGKEEFFAGVRDLYRLSLVTRESGGRSGIAEVRKAFHGQAEIVEKHWSGRLNAPENRLWDEDLILTSHDLIRWDQHPTYDGDSVTLKGTLLGDAVLSGETIAQARRDGYRNFHLYRIVDSKFMGNINPPGWTGGTHFPGDNIALEYRLEGRNFIVRFRFPAALGNPTDYFVDVWGFRNKSRTPIIWPDRDRLGYARIRVSAK